MSTIAELYSALQTGENAQEITNHLLEIYKNPQALSEIIDILQNNPDQTIRSHAAIGLKKVLNYVLGQMPNLDELKSIFLEILKNEQTIYVRKQIIHSIDNEIIMNPEWGEIMAFCSLLFQTGNAIHIETALILLFTWVKTLNQEQFSQIYQAISEIIVASISSENRDIQKAGYDLFAQSIPYLNAPLQPPFSEILTQFLSTFQEFVANDDKIAFDYGNILDHILRSNFDSFSETPARAFELDQILPFLLTLLKEPEVPRDLAFLSCVSPVHYLVTIAASSDELKANLQEIATSIVMRIALSFDPEECFDDKTLGCYTIELLVGLSCQLNPGKLFDLLVENISDGSPNEIYAKILVFKSFIDYSHNEYSTVASKHSHLIAEFLVSCLNPEMPHTIYEASLATLIGLIELVGDDLADFLDPIIDGCIKALSSEHPQLILYALKTLQIALDDIEFGSKYLPLLLPILSQIGTNCQDPELLQWDIAAISSIVYGAENAVIEYVPSFLPILVQGASLPETEFAIIKGESLKTICKIISLAPTEAESCIAPTLQILNECTQSQDPSILADLINSFTFLIKAESEPIRQCLPAFTEFGIQQIEGHQLDYCRIDTIVNEEEEETEYCMDVVDLIKKSLIFVEELAKFMPDLLTPYVEQVVAMTKGYTDTWGDVNQEIPQICLSTLTTLILTYHIDPHQFLGDENSLLTLFASSWPNIVCGMFDFFSVLINSGIEFHPDIIVTIFTNSLEAIEHKLDCYDEGEKTIEKDTEEEDADDDLNNDSQLELVKSAFKFLSTLVSKLPAFWNIDTLRKFLDSVRRADKKKYELEVIYSTDILGQIFEVNRSLFENLVLKFTLQLCVKSLSLCDGTNRPYPIVAIRRIIGTDAAVINADTLQVIFQAINAILELKTGPFYKDSCGATAALLFQIMAVQGDQFQFAQYFPQMLAALPSKQDAEYSLSTLIALFTSAPALFENCLNELIRIFAQVLALDDTHLEKYQLSAGTLGQMKAVLGQILSTVPNAMELIPSVVEDENARAILQARLNGQ